jgi:hypothetical protein
MFCGYSGTRSYFCYEQPTDLHPQTKGMHCELGNTDGEPVKDEKHPPLATMPAIPANLVNAQTISYQPPIEPEIRRHYIHYLCERSHLLLKQGREERISTLFAGIGAIASIATDSDFEGAE